MASIILAGPNIRLYVNNTLYKEVQSISLSVDYGEEGIYGIDSPYPQEIALTKMSVRGSIRGLRIKNSGGLQAKNMRPLWKDLAASPYISIRIQDMTSTEDIVFLPNAKVIREDHSVEIKKVYSLNLDFVAQIPLFALDRST
jgi:hypothetical protein